MAPRDAFEAGEDGSFPAWPRRPSDGKPAGLGYPPMTPGDVAAEEKMPTGLHKQRRPKDDKPVTVDMTPRHPDGTPIVPPDEP
jgi:hypothetical protein